MKNTGIASLLALLPLLFIGFGLLIIYSAGSSIGGYVIGFGSLIGWGWGYWYLGHSIRGWVAFISGVLVTLTAVFVLIIGLGYMGSPPENVRAYNDFAEDFFMAVLTIAVVAGIGLAIDAASLARRHNRMAQEKEQ